MYRFAQLGWDQPFADGIRIWADGYTVEVDIESSQGPRTSLELKTSHILLTLYQSVLAMSANTFLEVLAIMSLQRREIGVLRIQRLQSVSSNQSSSAGSLRALPHITTSVAANPSGTVKDNDDPQFTISYAYSGTRINSQDIFIAVLDAIAITAEHDVTSPFERLIAISASKKCEIIISGVVAKFQINNSFVIKALRILIFDVFVPLKTFGGMTFQLKFEGETFAEGKITAISPSNEGASAIEVAK